MRRVRPNTRSRAGRHNQRLQVLCQPVSVVIDGLDLVVEIGSEVRLRSDMMEFVAPSQEELQQFEEETRDSLAERDCEDSGSSDPEVWDDGG